MPTLDWIGKKAVLNHHRQVPYHLLRCDEKLSVGDPGSIRPDVEFADLAAHVYFTETGEPLGMPRNKPAALPGDRNGKEASPGGAGGLCARGLKAQRPSPLIGTCKGTAYYLLFNGILGDKRADGGNVLTGKVLDRLPAHDGPKVVYGEGCRLGAARLKRENIVFKQVPYEVKVS
jgi:adenine-specific DNA-methyltransferase